MKTLLTISAFLLLISFSKAQDTTLPQGICRIYLFSGKTLKEARLWKNDGRKLEFLKDENLHDVLISEVDYIKFLYGDYEFSDSARLSKIEYDVIIKHNNDSIFCFIKEIGLETIVFTKRNDPERMGVSREWITKYLLKGKEDVNQYTQYVAPAAEYKEATENTETGLDVKEIAEEKALSAADYYQMGKKDGRKEFKGNGSFLGGMFCGVIPFVGWIITPFTLAVPPSTSPQKITMYSTNKPYNQGYKDGAQKKKNRKTLGGFLMGVGMFLLLAL